MSTVSPFALPSLVQLFAGNTELVNLLRKKGFKSVPALMLLSLEDMEQDCQLDSSSARLVATKLLERGIAQRTSGGSVAEFIEAQWDCIEDAPVGILQVVFDRTQKGDKGALTPLEVISLIEDISPYMAVGELIEMTPKDISTLVGGGAVFGIQVLPGLTEETEELNARLEFYGLSLSEPQTLHSRRRLHLRAI